MALLSVHDLSVAFRGREVVHGVSFDVQPGETLALVGESGSGKSVTALSCLRLLSSAGSNPAGSITLDGVSVLDADERQLRELRGGVAGMVFQEPMTSLNPLHSIERQIAEAITLHRPLAGEALRARVIELLRLAGFPQAEERLGAYPHQLSGGQRQRVMIAAALANDPKLLIADEPTTALDVTIQAQILDLLMDLRDEFRMAIMIITHNMGVIAETADRVLVMYAGRVIEEAPVARIFDHPVHPYTRGLLECVPSITDDRARLIAIPGTLPDPARRPPGCRYSVRCRYARPSCSDALPPLILEEADHWAACLRAKELAAP